MDLHEQEGVKQRSIRVAGLRMPVTGDVAQNCRHIVDGIEAASRAGADILLTPEAALSGYELDFDRSGTRSALENVTATAAAVGVALALGTLFEDQDARFNQLRFYDSRGAYLGAHSKQLLCDPVLADVEGLVEAKEFACTPLRTFDVDGVTVGGLICNDLWAHPLYTRTADPLLLAQLASRGAQIVLHAANTGCKADAEAELNRSFHEAMLRLRVRATGTPVVTVDACDSAGSRPSCAPSGGLDHQGEWRFKATSTQREVFVVDMPLRA